MSDNLPAVPDSLETMDRALAMFDRLGRSGLLPEGINGPGDAAIIAGYSASLSRDPMWGLRNMHVIKGKPVLSADAMLALALAHPDCAFIIPVETTRQGATYMARRRSWPDEVPAYRYTFDETDARNAGLTGGMWKKYPKAMYRARCVSAICRAVFPDAVAGVYESSSGELTDGVPVQAHPVDARPRPQGNPNRPPQYAPEPHREPPVEDAEWSEAPAHAPGPTAPPTQPERPAGPTDALIQACDAAGVRLRVVEAVRDGEARYQFIGWRPVAINPDASRSILSTAAWFRNAAVVDAFRNADVAGNVDGATAADLRRAFCKSLHEALTARGLDMSNAAVAIAPNVKAPQWDDVKAAIGKVIAHDAEASK